MPIKPCNSWAKVVFQLAIFLKQKEWRQRHTTVTFVLAPATLGSLTQIGSFLLTKTSTVVTAACCCRWRFQVQTLPMYTSLKLWRWYFQIFSLSSQHPSSRGESNNRRGLRRLRRRRSYKFCHWKWTLSRRLYICMSMVVVEMVKML